MMNLQNKIAIYKLKQEMLKIIYKYYGQLFNGDFRTIIDIEYGYNINNDVIDVIKIKYKLNEPPFSREYLYREYRDSKSQTLLYPNSKLDRLYRQLYKLNKKI